jgi:hypothetical protein
MQLFLTKGLTQTAALWSNVQQGYAWVHRAAHVLANEEKQTAAQVRRAYEDFLTEMEQVPTSSETLATMLSTFRKIATSYWLGLFHCYDLPDLPRTNNELEQYLAQHTTMNDERPGENRLPRAWWYAELFGWSHPSLPVCILFLGRNFAQLISHDGARGASELDHRHEARRMQYRFRQSPEKYLAVLMEWCLICSWFSISGPRAPTIKRH